MSLVQAFPKEVPPATRAAVDPILPADSVCRLLGERADELFDEEALAEMYHKLGRGALNPVMMSIVVILQHLCKVPDRQAAENAVMRLDWLFALRQEIGWEGFDFSSLCNFRKRLFAHGAERLIFDQLLQYLIDKGYVKSKRQRTDSTHILGAVERLSRLELVWETLRLALTALLNADAKWVMEHLPKAFFEAYIERRSEFQLGKERVEQAMREAGQDGFWLLGQIERQGSAEMQELEAIQRLREVLEQQFEIVESEDGGGVETKPKVTVDGDAIASPHDPDARYGRKGDKNWLGAKAQVTETVDGDFPVIVDTDVRSANEIDAHALPDIQDRLEERGLKPKQQYVDGGYCNGKTLEGSERNGIDLRGRIGNASRKPPGFRLQDFDIDIGRRWARCPAGKIAVLFNPSSQSDVLFHVRFGKQCLECPFMGRCTKDKRGRHLELSVNHERLSRRRIEQAGAPFKREMYARARIESTICELARGHGLRQSRYRGRRKLQLQTSSTAAAVNLKRLARHLAGGFYFLQLPTLANGYV